MQKTVRCFKCSRVFVPPKEPPFFPCPVCREERLTARFAEHLVKPEHTEESVGLADQQDSTWEVVGVYSLLRHTIIHAGGYLECQEFMAYNGDWLRKQGYEYWELVPPHRKGRKHVEELTPPRHARPTNPRLRERYSPHYPKARPTTPNGVAEYQGYEIAGLRWVWVEEVNK